MKIYLSRFNLGLIPILNRLQPMFTYTSRFNLYYALWIMLITRIIRGYDSVNDCG